MSYSSGGLIDQADYNALVGTSTSTTANQINTIWAQGTGQYGWGQTAVANVASTNLVTAAQWTSMINTLDSIRKHQTGSATGFTNPVVSGTLISWNSTLQSTINTAYSAQTSITKASVGSTSNQGTQTLTCSAANGAGAQTFTATRTATFTSGDAARYFFNAGGSINFICGTATTSSSSARSSDLLTMINSEFVSSGAFGALTNSQRTGSGGTLATGGYTSGYYSLTTSAQTIASITSTTSGYTGDYVSLTVATNTTNSSGHGDKGYVLTYVLTVYSAARSAIPAPPSNTPGTGTTTNNTVVNDDINASIPHYLSVTYPETTNLSAAAWGTTVTLG